MLQIYEILLGKTKKSFTIYHLQFTILPCGLCTKITLRYKKKRQKQNCWYYRRRNCRL